MEIADERKNEHDARSRLPGRVEFEQRTWWMMQCRACFRLDNFVQLFRSVPYSVVDASILLGFGVSGCQRDSESRDAEQLFAISSLGG